MSDTTQQEQRDKTGTQFDQELARIAVGGYDDTQAVRKSMMNRVRDIIRKKNEGIPFDQTEDKKDEDERDYDSQYKDDNLPDLVAEMYEDGKLSDREFDYLTDMLQAGQEAEQIEKRYKSVMDITTNEPIFQQYLQHVKGISTVLTARLLHTYGYFEEFDKVTGVWAYSGLKPGQKRVKGEKLGYNPDAKTLAWLCADRIIMQGESSLYKTNFYDPYKEKQIKRWERSKEGLCIQCGQDDQVDTVTVNAWQCTDCNASGIGHGGADKHEEVMQERHDESHSVIKTEQEKEDVEICTTCVASRVSNGDYFPSAPKSRGHAHNRAVRYLAKKFLKHLWYISRSLKGLEVPDDYILVYGDSDKHEKRTDTFENPEYALDAVRNR